MTPCKFAKRKEGVMKILVIDDQRIFNFPNVIHCTTSQAGLEYLYNLQPWDEVWLDHDMGMDSYGSGSDLVDLIEESHETGEEPKPDVLRFYIHSFNPAGSEYMLRVLKKLGYNAERIDPSEFLDYEAMKEKGRNPNLAGPRR